MYSLHETDKVFDERWAQASMGFTSPQITHRDDGTVVVFESISGTIMLTSYGESEGQRLAGTFSASLSGRRTTSPAGAEEHTAKPLAAVDLAFPSANFLAGFDQLVAEALVIVLEVKARRRRRFEVTAHPRRSYGRGTRL